MPKAFSQKLGPPFSGQVQIAESDKYRAITLDGQTWELQYVNRIHVRVATVTAEELKNRDLKVEELASEAADPKLDELIDFLNEVTLPFDAIDHYECWLLDKESQQPLAMLYSCSDPEQMRKFPSHPEWTALPDSVIPIQKTEKELAAQMAPVNYRLERLVAEQAGINRKSQWYDRREHDASLFPPYLVRDHWEELDHQDLCSRYIMRQAPRLLMLQSLSSAQRQELESKCKSYSTEVARFYPLYPEVIDEKSMSALRVEARIRAATSGKGPRGVHDRRDGVLYI
ncbi:MAG: hypothetical protein KTR18_10305 [Acidiferrobacterales bacterium]|nr:hypothetical protein [Acidiferrobacterales bacterium]